MGDIDQGVKRLLQLRPQDFLEIAFPDANAEYLGPVETDVALEPQLITDSLQHARLYGQKCLIDFEGQAYPDAEMACRMFKYGARADILHDLPVISVVLILQPGATLPQPPYTRSIGPIPILTWHFHNVEIYRLRGRDIIDARMISLMPLVPFMADRSLEIVEEAAESIREQVTDSEQYMIFESLLVVFGSKYFGKETMLTLMGRLAMSIDTWKEFPIMKDLLEEAEAQGEVAALRRSIRRIVERRFGILDPGLAAAIDSADVATLDALEGDAVTEPLDAIRARLLPPTSNTPHQP